MSDSPPNSLVLPLRPNDPSKFVDAAKRARMIMAQRFLPSSSVELKFELASLDD